MEAADAFNRNDGTGIEQRGDVGFELLDALSRQLCGTIHGRLLFDPRGRAAFVAADGLRVVAAVGGVGVLAFAVGAQGEIGHRRPRPVVGEITDNG